MTGHLPTPPEPGPGQSVIQLRWSTTTEHVAYLVTGAEKGPIPQGHLDGAEAIWELCVQNDRNALTTDGVWEHRQLSTRVGDIRATELAHGGPTGGA